MILPNHLLTLAVATALAPAAISQVPSVVIRDGQLLHNGVPDQRVAILGRLQLAPDGAWAVYVSPTITAESFYWGNLAGGDAGSVLREAGAAGSTSQDFLLNQVGAASGTLAYGALSDPSPATGFYRRGLWIDDQLIARQDDPGPLPQTTWRDFAEVRMTRSGEPTFYASLNLGSTAIEALCRGTSPVSDLATGDVLAGYAPPIRGILPYRSEYSSDATHWIATTTHTCSTCGPFDTATSVDGAVLSPGGTPLVHGFAVPSQFGGPANEVWAFTSAATVNESGSYAVAIETRVDNNSHSRNILLRDGGIYLQEGDAVGAYTWLNTLAAQLLDNGDLYHFASIQDAAGGSAQALLVNQEIIFKSGDPVDWDRDGFADPEYTLAGFSLNAPFTGVWDVSDDGVFLAQGDVLGPNPLPIEAVLRVPYGIGVNYCDAIANSTGQPATMEAFGSRNVGEEALRLRANSVPAGSLGYFLVGDRRGNVLMPPGSSGRLCIGGMIGRFVGPGQVNAASPSGQLGLEVDLTQLPQPTGAVSVMPGDRWTFTAWFRDTLMGVPTSQFADGIEVRFR